MEPAKTKNLPPAPPPEGGGLAPSARLEAILERIRAGETDGVEDLRGLLRDAPDFLDAMGHLAWALAHRGEFEASIAVCRRYLEVFPQSVEMRWRIADRLVNLGRLDEALAAYGEVARDHPDCEDARMGVRYVEYLMRAKGGETFRGGAGRRPEPTALQSGNLALNQAEYREGRLRLRSLPPRLYLESTLKCNFYCQTCSKGHGPYYAEDLQRDILERVRREVMPANLVISITGFGEPTLARHFDEILTMALDNGSQTHFVTNGSLLNFRRLEQLCRQPVAVTISLDGATAETFESVRAGGKFERVLEKLAMIRKLRDIYLSSVYSHFSFNFVALRSNLHELPEVVRLARRYGIDVVGVADYAFNNSEFDSNSPRFAPEESNRYLAEARRVAEELGVRLDLPPPYDPTPPPPPRSGLWTKLRRARRLFSEPKRFPRRCSSPWTEPYIHTDGRVTPCCASNQYLGDLKKSAFAQVWNGWRYRLLRWRIHSPLPPPGCRSCFVCWGINGGNAGNVMAKEGLLVKAWYFFETRAGRWMDRLARKWRSLRGGVADPPPNYERGRPLRRSGEDSAGERSAEARETAS